MIEELEPLVNFVLNKKEEESDEEIVIYQRLLPQGKSKITNLDVKRARQISFKDKLTLKINDKDDSNIAMFGKLEIVSSKLVNRNFQNRLGYLDIKETTLTNCRFFETLYWCTLNSSECYYCTFKDRNSIIESSFYDTVFHNCNFYNEFNNTIIKVCNFNGCRFINCRFDDCEFIGCKFNDCTFNLPPVHSTFANCSFDACSGNLKANIKLT